MKHTKGPWVVDHVAEETGAEMFILDESKERMLCIVASTDQDLNTDLSDSELQADAHLIAAAPNGYAFAKRMKQYFDQNPDGYEDLRQMCEEYLAKAEGR